MNNWTIVGRLKDDAAIRGDRVKFLACVVVVSRRGFGSKAGQVFKSQVKVVMFGKNIGDAVHELKKGVLVQAVGEADIDKYESKTKRDKFGNPAEISVLKLIGRVEAMAGEGAPPPQSIPSEYDDGSAASGGESAPAHDPAYDGSAGDWNP